MAPASSQAAQESWEWRSSFSDIGTTSNGSERSRKALLLSTLSSPATSCHTIQVSSKLLPRHGTNLLAQGSSRNTKQVSTGDGCTASNGDCSLLKWSATGSLPIIGGPSSAENRRKRGGQVGKSNLVFFVCVSNRCCVLLPYIIQNTSKYIRGLVQM